MHFRDKLFYHGVRAGHEAARLENVASALRPLHPTLNESDLFEESREKAAEQRFRPCPRIWDKRGRLTDYAELDTWALGYRHGFRLQLAGAPLDDTARSAPEPDVVTKEEREFEQMIEQIEPDE